MEKFTEKNPKPSLCENCVIVVVHHMNLGRSDKFFSNNNISETVYYWIGSLPAFVKKVETLLNIIKRITRSAIIVEINTKDVKLVKTNISSLRSKRHFVNVFWNVKTKY